MQGLIAFWSHALAAAMFLGLLIWRLGAGARDPGQRLLLAGFAVTACWAWLSAIAPGEPLARFAETARNLIWVGLLYSLSVKGSERQHGVKLVYAAVGAVMGFQLVADTARQAKFFAGFAGWSAGQLEGEMAEGSWRVLPATVEHVFAVDADLWDRLMREHSGKQILDTLHIRHVPPDLRMN